MSPHTVFMFVNGFLLTRIISTVHGNNRIKADFRLIISCFIQKIAKINLTYWKMFSINFLAIERNNLYKYCDSPPSNKKPSISLWLGKRSSNCNPPLLIRVEVLPLSRALLTRAQGTASPIAPLRLTLFHVAGGINLMGWRLDEPKGNSKRYVHPLQQLVYNDQDKFQSQWSNAQSKTTVYILGKLQDLWSWLPFFCSIEGGKWTCLTKVR